MQMGTMNPLANRSAHERSTHMWAMSTATRSSAVGTIGNNAACSETNRNAGIQMSQVLQGASSTVLPGGQGHAGSSRAAALSAAGGGEVRGCRLITGGTGALGSAAACWQAGAAPHAPLMLTGTSGRFSGSQAASRQLHEQLLAGPACVTILAADLASVESIASLMQLATSERPLELLMHAGGVLQDDLVANQTPRYRSHCAQSNTNTNTHTYCNSVQGSKIFWKVSQ